MTKDYAAIRLLEHGPLSAREFIEITGWPPRIAYKQLYRLAKHGLVARSLATGVQGYVYALAT